MILLAPPAPGVIVHVEGDGALRFVQNGKLSLVKRASLRIQNGSIASEAGVLAPRIAIAVPGPIAVGLDGTIKVSGKSVGRIVLAVNGSLANPGEGLAGVVRAESGGKPKIRIANSESRTPTVTKFVPPARPAPAIGNGRIANHELRTPIQRIAITVRPRTEVEGDRIALGDVAEIEAPAALLPRLKALDLGRTPPLGSTRGISGSYVRALVRALGARPEEIELTIPEGALAERRGVVIEAQQFLDAALDLPEASGFIPARPPVALTVPQGQLALKPEVLVGASGRSVTITAIVDGKPVGKRSIALVLDPNAPTVKIGETVRLRLITGAASVEVSAKVKTGGRVGTSVTVVSSTGSIHTGKLISPSVVEVKL